MTLAWITETAVNTYSLGNKYNFTVLVMDVIQRLSYEFPTTLEQWERHTASIMSFQLQL
jgi:hypothetical protein